jgi:hypothetical protein
MRTCATLATHGQQRNQPIERDPVGPHDRPKVISKALKTKPDLWHFRELRPICTSVDFRPLRTVGDGSKSKDKGRQRGPCRSTLTTANRPNRDVRDESASVRSWSSQKSDHKARYVIHKPPGFFVGKHVWATQNGRMRQRLHRRRTDERGDIRIDNINLISMRIKIASNKRVDVAVDSLCVFEPPGTRNLLDNTMKLGIDAVGINHDRNELASRDLDRARSYFDQRVPDHLRHLARMAVNDGRHQRFLAREVLVERAYTDTGHGSDLVGTRLVISFFHQNTSSCF